MPKRKKKSNEQPLFIHFVNCKFERKTLLTFFNKTLKSFYPKKNFSKATKPLSNKELFRRCFTDNLATIQDIIERDFKEMLEGGKFYHADNIEEAMKMAEEEPSIEDETHQFLIAMMGLNKELSFQKLNFPEREEYESFDLETKKAYEVTQQFNTIYAMALSQFQLKEILARVINREKLEKRLLIEMNSSEDTKLVLGEETYLKRIHVKRRDRIRELIVQDLVEFLCTPDWNKLNQCKECRKFFVAKTNWQKFCKFNGDKCRNDYNNRERVKSGKHAETMKRGREEGKYQ
jgi:hypothetical protein